MSSDSLPLHTVLACCLVLTNSTDPVQLASAMVRVEAVLLANPDRIFHPMVFHAMMNAGESLRQSVPQ
jgi:hypothetical protein